MPKSLTVSPSPSRPVIVLVDDDRALLNALTFSFEAEGMSVLAFANGEALLSASVPTADCFVIDERLPRGMSGVELLRELRANGVTTPALLITTNPGSALFRRAADLGATVVEKPLLGSTLSAAVHRAIEMTPH